MNPPIKKLRKVNPPIITNDMKMTPKFIRRILYVIGFILILMWYKIYISPENSLLNFSADLYGEKISQYLYKLPPDRYLIKTHNDYLGYDVSIYSKYGEVGEQSFSSLVDPSTFRFVRKEWNDLCF